MGFTKTDARVYASTQSGKGTAGSAFKTAEQMVTWSHATDKQYVAGVAGLGKGIWRQKNTGTTWRITDQLEIRPAMGTMLGILLACDHTRATTGSGTEKTHTFTPIARNVSLNYLTLGLVWGEQGTPGTGAMTLFERDAKITSRVFTIDSEDVFKVTAGFGALNEGPGAGTETFAEDTNTSVLQPSGPSANAYTYPSWFPSGLCVNSLQVAWNPNVVIGKACLGSGEPSDILIDEAGYTITGTATVDATTGPTLYKYINYLKTTSLTAFGAMNSALAEGGASFLINSSDVIPTTTTPYSFTMAFPNLQWNKVTWNTGVTPHTVEFEATSFANAHTFVLVNGLSASSMAI